MEMFIETTKLYSFIRMKDYYKNQVNLKCKKGHTGKVVYIWK